MSVIFRLSIENYQKGSLESWWWSEFFQGRDKAEALNKIRDYLKMQNIKPYIGVNENVYPKFVIEHIIIR